MDVCTHYFIEHIMAMSSICTAGTGSHEEEGWKYDCLTLCFTDLSEDHVSSLSNITLKYFVIS